jgi:diaminopimelate epimerase
MKQGSYIYADPTGNITLLAPMPEDDSLSLSDAASALMEKEPDAEQIGFLSPGDADCDVTLHMAGGEFCGNAAMSAAAVYALFPGLNSAVVHVRVSGAPDPIVVQIRTADEQAHLYIGTVEMPSPVSMEDLTVPLAHGMLPVTAVRLPGIVHLITDTPVEKESAEEAIRQWCSLFQADALGLILLDRQSGTLTPLVYVHRSNTLFWESSCASGTTAAGAVLRSVFGPGSWTFSEPAGKLTIEATADGRLLLTGRVRIEERSF